MEIIVCIKQVPETGDIKIDPTTNTLIREGVSSIINPYDLYAIEEAVRIKEKLGAKVKAISMGPAQTETALREAIALGCDQGFLISDIAFAGSDTWATSYTLAKAIKKIGNFDLIICGKQAMDGDTAQVGPGISVQLDIPQVTFIRKIVKIDSKSAQVQRMTEAGYELLEVPLPCLLTVVKEINQPRLPSLKGKMRAKSTTIIKWNHQDIQADPERIGLAGSPTQVVKIFSPPPRPGGQIVSGSSEEVVEKLVNILKDVIAGCK